jgi:hypothetical protein
MPYSNDLVRLAASALLAIDMHHLKLDAPAACSAILDGYRDALKDGGGPFVLAEQHAWLRSAVTSDLRDPTRFWDKLSSQPSAGRVPPNVLRSLIQAMPEPRLKLQIVHRQAGLGSLGRERFTALARWRGAWVARETKPLLPSAYLGAPPPAGKRAIYYSAILEQSLRAPDPFVKAESGWLVRRLAPYCSRIELFQLRRGGDEKKLLQAMGHETANIHLGTRGAARSILRDLKKRKPKWLRQAAEEMTRATTKDWKEWRSSW